jgi:hypothetical protein
MTDEATNDTTDGQLSDPLDELDPDLRGYLSRYRSVLLSEQQRPAYLDDLKRMAAAVPLLNELDAQQMLLTACRFMVDRNPVVGTRLSVLFTEAQVAIWMNDQARCGKGGRTPNTARGRLRRLVRVAFGQPGRNDRVTRPVVLPEPWSDGVLAAMTAALGTAEQAAALRAMRESPSCALHDP